MATATAARAREPATSLATTSQAGYRWLALAFIALAQLMVALDATIVNIALPSAQTALQFSDGQRQWVISAYPLAFGGLLLLGGRLADAIGRKRALLIGLSGFAIASALSGAATDLGMLITAPALQGAFGALLAPSALSLVAVTFTEPRDRARALTVYGAIAGSGGAAGLALVALLSQYLDWRWCLCVNVPIAIVAAAGALRLLSDLRPASRPRFDLLGVLLGALGLVALWDACSEAVGQGLRSPLVLLVACRRPWLPRALHVARGAHAEPTPATAHRARPRARWRLLECGAGHPGHVRRVPVSHLRAAGGDALSAVASRCAPRTREGPRASCALERSAAAAGAPQQLGRRPGHSPDPFPISHPDELLSSTGRLAGEKSKSTMSLAGRLPTSHACRPIKEVLDDQQKLDRRRGIGRQ